MEYIENHKKAIIITLILILVIIMMTSILLFYSVANRINYSKEDIKNIAKKEIGGTITEIEVDHNFLKTYYELTIINDNREYEVIIDASNGSIIKLERDD
ncbi:MAG: PepSY domain-containing protein [Anaerorhabdus sp.]